MEKMTTSFKSIQYSNIYLIFWWRRRYMMRVFTQLDYTVILQLRSWASFRIIGLTNLK